MSVGLWYVSHARRRKNGMVSRLGVSRKMLEAFEVTGEGFGGLMLLSSEARKRKRKVA